MKLTDIKQALAAYQTGNYPKHGDASRTLETLTKALPHLIAIAEAARSGACRHSNDHDGTRCELCRALNELEKA